MAVPHPDKALNSILGLGLVTNVTESELHNATFNGHKYHDTLPSPCSSDISGSLTSKSILSASSVSSNEPGEIDASAHFNVQLPEPFHPPSIAQANTKLEIKPRALPYVFGLPLVPQEQATSAIDPQDKYVSFLDHML
jgi:hypothetical protein